MGEGKEEGAKLFSMIFSEQTRGDGHKLDYTKSNVNVRKDISFYREDGQRLETGYIVESNILGNTQNSTGQCLEQPAVIVPALSREVGQGDLQRTFPTSAILCDSIKTQFEYRYISGKPLPCLIFDCKQ